MELQHRRPWNSSVAAKSEIIGDDDETRSNKIIQRNKNAGRSSLQCCCVVFLVLLQGIFLLNCVVLTRILLNETTTNIGSIIITWNTDKEPPTPPTVFYLNNGCDAAWRRSMGYTGECVQHDALLWALSNLSVPCLEYQKDINAAVGTLAWPKDAQQLCELVTTAQQDTPHGGNHTFSNIPASSSSPSSQRPRPIFLVGAGHEIAQTFQQELSSSCPQLPSFRVALLDWFGTNTSNAPRKVEILSVLPAPGNTFLGYALFDMQRQQHDKMKRIFDNNSTHNSTTGIISNRSGNIPYGLVLGKFPKYFASTEVQEILQHVAQRIELKCLGCQRTSRRHQRRMGQGGGPGITTLDFTTAGDNSQQAWRDELAGTRFLLGVGDPIGSPSVLEAIFLGCRVILPRHRKPATIVMGRAHESQYDHLVELIQQQPSLEPYVCWYTTLVDLEDCVQRAITNVLPPIDIEAYTPHGFRSRVEAWIYSDKAYAEQGWQRGN